MLKKERQKYYGKKAQLSILKEVTFDPEMPNIQALLDLGSADYFMTRAREAMSSPTFVISEVQRYLLLAALARCHTKAVKVRSSNGSIA